MQARERSRRRATHRALARAAWAGAPHEPPRHPILHVAVVVPHAERSGVTADGDLDDLAREPDRPPARAVLTRLVAALAGLADGRGPRLIAAAPQLGLAKDFAKFDSKFAGARSASKFHRNLRFTVKFAVNTYHIIITSHHE